MNTIEMIEVMHSFLDGERLQHRERGHGGRWYDMDCIDPLWDFEVNEYRIKPEEPEEGNGVRLQLTKEQVSQIVIMGLLSQCKSSLHFGHEKEVAAMKDALKVFGYTETRLQQELGV